MAFRVCVLASGSSGNCTFVGSDTTGVLIDAGLSGREIDRRLGQIAVSLGSIQGICVSHEHSDHTAGLGVLHRRHRIPVYANSGTIEVLSRDQSLAAITWQIFTTGASFAVGDIAVEPFTVPHDAMDPVGFIMHHGEARIAVLTDIGMPTTLVRDKLRRCRAVIVESNHDERLLDASKRPWSLKSRIKGRQGHLSNRKAAEMLAEIAGPDLQHVFLAHLSAECNKQDLALQTVQSVLDAAGHRHVRVSLTYPDRISEMWSAEGPAPCCAPTTALHRP